VSRGSTKKLQAYWKRKLDEKIRGSMKKKKGGAVLTTRKGVQELAETEARKGERVSMKREN